MKPRILIVDDETRMCRSLQILLLGEGKYDVSYALSGDLALKYISSHDIDLMIVDLSMPGMNGLELLKKVKYIHSDMPVVIMTAYSSVKSAIEAMKGGAFEYLIKPFGNEEFLSVVDRALEEGKIAHEVRSVRHSLHGYNTIIGKSQKMEEVFSSIEKAANTDSTVLILGESGTGKELVAKEIHEAGKRRTGPFVTINCAALPETLLESELFGYEKGAFTGAVRTQVGKFERAHEGTLFLDEIGDMSPWLQTKILRFLQEREFERVGGRTPIKVDVRIIAATNRDLNKALDNESFRKDLYYRLSVITIELPPLRERKDDIPLLVSHFLENKGKRLEKEIKELSSEAWHLLLDHDYPGNVRELENIIERSIIESQGDRIEAKDLQIKGSYEGQSEIGEEIFFHGLWKVFRLFLGVEDMPLKGGWTMMHELIQSLTTELEHKLVEKAVKEHPSLSNTELADLLGTTRRILELRLKEFGIRKDTFKEE
ncbi:MAG TPA: sigma-54 dependent transcriptional regulator [Thermodesulfobacteriota bacterium]